MTCCFSLAYPGIAPSMTNTLSFMWGSSNSLFAVLENTLIPKSTLARISPGKAHAIFFSDIKHSLAFIRLCVLELTPLSKLTLSMISIKETNSLFSFFPFFLFWLCLQGFWFRARVHLAHLGSETGKGLLYVLQHRTVCIRNKFCRAATMRSRSTRTEGIMLLELKLSKKFDAAASDSKMSSRSPVSKIFPRLIRPDTGKSCSVNAFLSFLLPSLTPRRKRDVCCCCCCCCPELFSACFARTFSSCFFSVRAFFSCESTSSRLRLFKSLRKSASTLLWLFFGAGPPKIHPTPS